MPLIIEQIILAIGKIQGAVNRTRCSFKVGDMVELKDGTGYPMLVTRIDKTRQMKEPLLSCRWYDRHTKETRINLFPESKLIHFGWEIKA